MLSALPEICFVYLLKSVGREPQVFKIIYCCVLVLFTCLFSKPAFLLILWEMALVLSMPSIVHQAVGSKIWTWLLTQECRALGQNVANISHWNKVLAMTPA